MSDCRSHEARLLDIIDIAYTVAGESEMVSVVFAALRELMPFSSGVFLPVDAQTLELRQGVCFDCDPADMEKYLAHYAALDPYVLRKPSPAHFNQTVFLSEVIEATELGRSEFSRFMGDVPYSRAAAIITAVEGQAVAVFSVHRQRDDQDFNDAERAVINRIAPHMARAITLRQLADDPIQRVQTGILVFGARGEVLYANAAAHRYLGTSRPQALLSALPPGGSGAISFASQNYRVSKVPWAAASLLHRFAVEEAATRQLCPRDADDEPVARWSATTKAESVATIVALQPFRLRTNASRRLARHGLSHRQSEVAESVCRGISNLEIALQLGISERTVKDHLVDVFRLLEVSSRTALIGKLVGIMRDRPSAINGRR